MTDELLRFDQEQIQGFLQDESKCTGWAESISFPETEEEIQALVALCQGKHLSLTIQGNLTGICGGAVPQGGHILNLSKMNRILEFKLEEGLVRVEPGLLLQDLNQALRKKQREKALFFPPDPTEALASIGGMAACNASGAGSYFYGATRNYVHGIRMVTAQGILHVRRGEKTQEALLQELGEPEGSFLLEKKVLGKNVAGYDWQPNGDAVDLLLSSEGSLGIISELELRLMPVPMQKMGILFFFRENELAIEFVRWIRGENVDWLEERPVGGPIAIEYMNQSAFQIVKEFRELKPELKRFQQIPHAVEAGVYLEFHEESEEKIEQVAEQLLGLNDHFNMVEGQEWCAFDEESLEQIRVFRHAVPECANLRMVERKTKESRLRKLGTDFAVPNDKLKACMIMYQQGLDQLGIDSLIFGHIGDNHLHINFLPKTWEEAEKSQLLIAEWESQVIAWRGTITAEHGVGRTKRSAFQRMYSSKDVQIMKSIKERFDPEGIFNPGVIFDAKKPAKKNAGA
ncbi:FAD-binding oxidoreductase [Gottschalkiaceae bacterium SANA]|nr:FAD-binding oxidoreductase [Gottschalkiaceae bacterium SANA]